jgi:hypothetical protein
MADVYQNAALVIAAAWPPILPTGASQTAPDLPKRFKFRTTAMMAELTASFAFLAKIEKTRAYRRAPWGREVGHFKSHTLLEDY